MLQHAQAIATQEDFLGLVIITNRMTITMMITCLIVVVVVVVITRGHPLRLETFVSDWS